MDQSLVNFVLKLKKLNDIKINTPKVNAKDIIKNPRQFALDFVELEFAKALPKYIQSYNLGKKFGKDLIKNGKKSKTDV